MQTKKLISILIIAIVAILMLTTVVASAEVVSAAKVKVTWNANGGKIGTAKTKVTSINKGAKIKTLPKTPKRTGYIFNGWYTKKTGGKKITSSTKVKKKVTYYAQWKKKINPNIDPKLIGSWRNEPDISLSSTSFREYAFYDNGTFKFINNGLSSHIKTGNYKVSGGKVTFTNVIVKSFYSDDVEKYPNTVIEYQFAKDSNGKEYLKMAQLNYPDESYLSIESWVMWRRW